MYRLPEYQSYFKLMCSQLKLLLVNKISRFPINWYVSVNGITNENI